MYGKNLPHSSLPVGTTDPGPPWIRSPVGSVGDAIAGYGNHVPTFHRSEKRPQAHAHGTGKLLIHGSTELLNY